MAHPTEVLVTAEEVRRLFRYDPDTGEMTRRVTLCGRALAGQRVGTRKAWGHLSVKIGRRQYFLHRLAWLYMTGSWPSQQIDHVNGSPDDNRWSNLREASNQLNCQNRRRPSRTSVTGFLGVHYQYGKYKAAIKVDGVKHYLGVFATPEEAHAAYVERRNRLLPNCAI